MRITLLAFCLAALGCTAPSQPTSVSPRGMTPASPDPVGHSDIAATWRVVGYQSPSTELAAETGLLTGCGVTPVAKDSEFWGRTIIVDCPADTPVDASILVLRDGTCSLVYPRPACGAGKICDPRPGIELATCPPNAGSPRSAE